MVSLFGVGVLLMRNRRCLFSMPLRSWNTLWANQSTLLMIHVWECNFSPCMFLIYRTFPVFRSLESSPDQFYGRILRFESCEQASLFPSVFFENVLVFKSASPPPWEEFHLEKFACQRHLVDILGSIAWEMSLQRMESFFFDLLLVSTIELSKCFSTMCWNHILLSFFFSSSLFDLMYWSSLCSLLCLPYLIYNS